MTDEYKLRWPWVYDAHCEECGEQQDTHLEAPEAEVERLRAENAALRELLSQLMASADVLAKVGSWSFDITDEEVTAAENALAQARALLSR